MQSATTIVVVETPLHPRPAAADSLLPRERATAARSMREMVGGAGSVRRASRYRRSRDAPRTRCRCRCLRGPSLPASSHVTRPADIGSAIHRPPRVPSSTCRVRERKRMRSGEREREKNDGGAIVVIAPSAGAGSARGHCPSHHCSLWPRVGRGRW